MGCIKCIGSILCIIVLAVAGILTWRFGPWYDKSSDASADGSPDMSIANSCEGCCNLLGSNCALPVSDVTFAMVHNAHSSAKDLFAGYNNEKTLEEALVAGYRGLMLDSCLCDGSLGETLQNFVKGATTEQGESFLGFCHSTCDAGVRDPSEVLRNIKIFLDVNRNEVLILEFEILDNSLGLLHGAIDDSGLDDYVYIASSAAPTEWPTMQELIDANARLLLFAHGDGMQSCRNSDCPEGVFYTYDHFQQTDWNDDTCELSGGGSPADASAVPFFLMNHWMNNDYDLPSKANAVEFNAYDALTERFGRCEGRVPNVVAVDFWDTGDVLSFVKEVNQRNAGGGSAVAAAGARSQSQGDD